MATITMGQMTGHYQGALMEQATSISLRTESGVQVTPTMLEGVSGFTFGSGQTNIEVSLNVPASGPEVPAQEDSVDKKDVTMQINLGGKSWAGVGKVESVEFSQSTGDTFTMNFTWVGAVKKIK